MRAVPPEVLEILRCSACESGAPLVGGSRGLECSGCGRDFPYRNGYLDLHTVEDQEITPIQHLCQFPPMIAIYDNIWRPFGYFLTSSRSFPKDLDRITRLVAPDRRRMVLDVGCGPGNFTRSIASYDSNTKVVGFDLARQMLERAGRLTPAGQFSNVCYLRGSALEMPFESGSFDAVICCAALQLFIEYDQAISEIARVLKTGGEFVCQTVVSPSPTPLWLKFADRVMKFGYFDPADLKQQLHTCRLDIVDEEASKVSYIFRAAKAS